MPQALDVLVVGAGPTGLTAALELAWAGIRCRIVDQAPERSTRSRALAVQARTLELLARHGISGPLVERGRRSLEVSVFVHKREAARATLGDVGAEDSPYPFVLFVSQAETERLLEERLGSHDIAVERPVKVTKLEPSADDVRVELEHGAGRTEVVRARYVIGADGAHSTVRKAAGLSFEGSPYPQDFILADVDVTWDLPPDRVCFLLGGEALVAALPLGGHRRLIALRPGSGAADQEPTLPELEALLSSVSPAPARLGNPTWLTRFRLHHRGVNLYRKGRLFVAGDAAHIHSPAGGQGMNTGIQDAVNLAWKLAYALQGRAGEPLLDSYHDERFPVGQRLLHFTDRLFSVASSGNPLLVAARNALIPRVLPLVLKSPARREWAFRFISQLKVRYRSSPVVSESLVDLGDLFHAGPCAGDRVPDAPLVRATDGARSSVHGELTGPAHTLLLFPCDSSPAALRHATDRSREFSGWVQPIVVSAAPVELDPGVRGWVDETGTLHRRLGVRRCAHLLIRPDGHFAYRATGLALEGVPLFLRRAYGAP